MSILATTRRNVKRTLAPVPSNVSRVLFDATRRIKSPYVFGLGILRTLPSERRSHTAADEAWAADALNNRSDWDNDTVLDQRAAEFHAVDRLCRGYCL
jgi:hypothetical protein